MNTEPLRTRRDYGASDGVNDFLNTPPTKLVRDIPNEKDPAKKKQMQDALEDWRITTPGPFWKSANGEIMSDEIISSLIKMANELIASENIIAEEVKEGGPYIVDMSIVKKFDSNAPYLNLIRKEIKNGDGTVDVKYVQNGKAGISGTGTHSFLLGDIEVPVEALKKASITATEEATTSTVEKVDPQLNTLAEKVKNDTGGDLGKMLTLVMMALRKAGHADAASKVHSMFKAIDKKMDKLTS